MKKYIAEIIDNNDPDTEGKCQIYIEPLHHDLQPSQYQWARQDREWTSNIPEIGDFVWVWFQDEEFYRKPYYQNKINLKNYNEQNESIGNISGSYPDIKYLKLANGVSIALNSNQTEVTIVAGNAEIFIDSSGNINLNGNSKSFVTYTELNTALQNMLTLLNADIVKANGQGGTATGTTTLDISSAETITILTGG
jgi:hypothetical protein